MALPITRSQVWLFRLIAVPLAALIASHVAFYKTMPWQPGYRFPWPYFFTVVTVMMACWQANLFVFNGLDRRTPFYQNPKRRILLQVLIGGAATLATFALVFPASQRIYTGMWPSLSVLAVGVVVCVVIATLVNGTFVGLYLLQTIYMEKQDTHALNLKLAEMADKNYDRRLKSELLLIETNRGMLLLNPKEVAYFYSTAGMVLLVTVDGEQVPTAYSSLSSLLEKVDNRHFFPLSRQFVVGLNAVRSVQDGVNRKLLVSLKPALRRQEEAELVVVSRYRSAELKKWLAKIGPIA